MVWRNGDAMDFVVMDNAYIGNRHSCKKKEERNPLQKEHVEGIGSIVGMHPYNRGGGSLGGGCKQLGPGACGF